jgi:hypothetical protein
MKHSRTRRLAAIVALGVTAAVTLVAAANAGQIFSEQFRDEPGSEIINDFCGVAGLTVNFATVADGHVHAVSHGRDGLVYFGAQIRQDEVVTNVNEPSNVVRSRSTFVDKDLRITDNGDGTLTILIMTTGNAVLYGADGKAIARNPGQVRFELVVDHGGTPNDPEDDEEISFEIVKESTGRTDDFCALAVPLLTA